MEIDWFTLVAQIVNFLILVLVLKYLLYDRIVGAMERRREMIAGRLEKAEKKIQEAEKEGRSYRQKTSDLEDRRQEILDQARQEAREQREELLEEARQEAQEARQRWRRDLHREKENFVDQLRRQAGRGVIEVSRKVLSDLAELDVEEQLVKGFLKRWKDPDEDRQEKIASAAEESKGEVEVHSAFEMSEKLRQEVAGAITERIGEDVRVSFETSPNLIAGLAVQIAGRTVTWNLADYLDHLEEEILQDLEERRDRSQWDESSDSRPGEKDDRDEKEGREEDESEDGDEDEGENGDEDEDEKNEDVEDEDDEDQEEEDNERGGK